MVIKSGTNQFHGNGFYYWRDNTLAATPWATNRLGGTKSEFSREHLRRHAWRPAPAQQAVLLRELPGRRVRRRRRPTPSRPSCPTRGGRAISAACSRGTIVIRDPLTGQPFPNNQIPVSRFSAFARNLFADESLYPRAERRASDQRLPRELPRHDRVEGRRRPVRREDGLERLGEGQAVRAVFEAGPEVGNLADGDAAAVRVGGVTNPSWSVAANWNRIIGGDRGQRPARRATTTPTTSATSSTRSGSAS